MTSSSYFDYVYDCLYIFQSQAHEAPWADLVSGRLEQLLMDTKFLKKFCFCHETWDYTTSTGDEQKLRSLITHLEVIWTKEYKGRESILDRLTETWPVDVQHFHLLAFELEGIIHQCKLQIEQWCESMVRNSLMYNLSTFDDVCRFLYKILRKLNNLSSYRAKKINPGFLDESLKKKIVFLDDSLENAKHLEHNEKFFPFVVFARDFVSRATCLTCLYWAKEEVNEEMNIFLFYMFLKLIPYAPDIIPLCVGLLDSYSLQPSDSIHLTEAVGGFVDFFFDHLATTLKDDFLILRGRLIFLFTFLTYPRWEKKDLIRSQIYALFNEDAYLVMPFDEMKRDFLDKKILLNDCMIKIEIAIANMGQLYYGLSDSLIRFEVEKMDYKYFVSVQIELSSIKKNAQWADLVRDQLKLYKMELRFLRVFLLCFATWDDTDKEIRVRLSSMITSLQVIWGKEEEKGPLDVRLRAKLTGDVTDWHLLALELQGKIQSSKLEIEAWCINLIHCSFQCRSSSSNMILDFLDLILHNLNDLVSYKAGKTIMLKMQIETLEEKLVFLKNMLELTVNCPDSQELDQFNQFVQVVANDAACLAFQYWAKEANGKIVTETHNVMLSHMLQKIKPVTPDVARLYFGIFMSVCMQRSNSLLFGQTALTFVDLVLEDMAIPFKNEFQILRDNIIFLLTFLNDPPDDESICSQIDVLFWEGVYGVLPFDDINGSNFSKKKVNLSDFMMKIDTINANIKQLHYEFPDISPYYFPKVISPRFLDFLIENLRNLNARMITDKKYVPFAKNKIMNIVEELVALCPFFNQIYDFLQSELHETWLQAVNVLYLTEHVISLSLSSWFVFDNPIWYHMACLSDVYERIKDINTMIKENNMFNVGSSPRSADIITTLSGQAMVSKPNEVMVGFEDEVEKITGNLTWGYTSFDIVSIVGMGGLGKTTLARKIYGSSLVKHNFDVFAFCSVSQAHNTQKLLFDILCDIKGTEDGLSSMSEDDLAHHLWQCLSRQKYLIVLDDIWDANAWYKVKSSFPDDKNGSRVMFTTRSREVADKCKINCIPHELRFLSLVESWELLQKMVFQNSVLPPDLYEIGKVIAKNCKGLPLAVVVIAGLLARTDRSQSSWTEIGERVGSYLFNEGCMDILELSYSRLPEYLKPCLLYLGAFPEDEYITVKELILLWIAEGFVQEYETRSLEDVAKEYLCNLADRCLVIVSERNSSGGIKKIRVHDLIHDLCQTKCRDGNFFQVRHGSAASNTSDPSLYNLYRFSTLKKSDFTVPSVPGTNFRRDDDIIDDSGLALPNIRSLLYFWRAGDKYEWHVLLNELKLSQLLHLTALWERKTMHQLASLIHLRHIKASIWKLRSIPIRMSNMWNLQSLILDTNVEAIDMPENLWRMKTLRHVKVTKCQLTFSDGPEHEEACPQLDKVVSFSSPILSTGKDVKQFLQRLPAVRNLGCVLNKSLDSNEEGVETLDFYRKLKSLKLTQSGSSTYSFSFPSTLKKLTLVRFKLPWTAISAIAQLQYLQVLKLRQNIFPEPVLEMEDVIFPSLVFFELHDEHLLQWDATAESFPCLEQLVLQCKNLEELPVCFEEITTLKRIVVVFSTKVESSALRIQKEQMELGKEVEVKI